MGKSYQFVKIDRIIASVKNLLGDNINVSDIIEWTGMALDGLGIITSREERVAFIKIKNYQGTLPKRFKKIIQVARNNNYTESNIDSCITEILEEKDCGCKDNVEVPKSSPCGCGNFNGIALDCNGTPIQSYEIAYYRPYFDLQYEYYGWNNSRLRREKYTPIRLANHSFFSELICEESPEVYSNIVDEYTLNDNKIITSFKDGYIALAYYRERVDDETGYPLIPDNYSVIMAITNFIIMMYCKRMYYLGREGFSDKFQKAEQDWQWYCKQASNDGFIPNTLDEYQNITESRLNLIPDTGKYYSFFKTLGRR